jgi:hypothetical protein
MTSLSPSAPPTAPSVIRESLCSDGAGTGSPTNLRDLNSESMIEFHDVESIELSIGLWWGGANITQWAPYSCRAPCQRKRPSGCVLAWWGFFVGDTMAKYAPIRRQFTPGVYPGTPKFTPEFTPEPQKHPLMAPLWLGEQL